MDAISTTSPLAQEISVVWQESPPASAPQIPPAPQAVPRQPDPEPKKVESELWQWFEAMTAAQYRGDYAPLRAMATKGGDMPGVIFRSFSCSLPGTPPKDQCGEFRLVTKKIKRRGKPPALSTEEAAALFLEMCAAYDADGRRIKDAVIDEFAARDGRAGKRTLYKIWEIGECAIKLSAQQPEHRRSFKRWFAVAEKFLQLIERD